MGFDIERHAEKLVENGFDRVRIDMFLAVARAGHLRRAFSVLTRPICGAHTKRYGGRPCFAKPLANGKCRLHGGLSTGSKTPEGRQRQREAALRRWAKWREAKEYKEVFE